jgi:magnesium transporter
MVWTTKRHSKKAGLPPGTLVHVGEKKVEHVRIRATNYDHEHVEQQTVRTIDECLPFKEKPGVTWISIEGLHDVDAIEKLGACFGLHPLVMEDIVHTEQRAKIEDFDDYIFIILKMLTYDDKKDRVMAEQFSIVLGPSYVLSFQEGHGEIFDQISERIRLGQGRIRRLGADYLMYALMDAVVDHYFGFLEAFEDSIEEVEEGIVVDPAPEKIQRIYHLRRELVWLRKSIWPLREAIDRLVRAESNLIQEKTTHFLRDVYDHAIQIIDTIETLKDMVFGLQDLYHSSVSNRINEVMKMLTVIATIFIPLTFIAGVYGMNFKRMPELDWPWGYPLVLGIMLVLSLVMLVWFRKKRFF